MTLTVVGIDVSQATFDVAVLKEGHRNTFQLSNTKKGFRVLLQKLKGTEAHLCMEATSLYWLPLATALYQAGHTVSVVNPLCIRRYGESRLRRNKTDKADAQLIAAFCLKEQPRPWKPLAPDYAQLRELFRRREQLLKAKQAEMNRLKAGFTVQSVRESFRRIIQLLRLEIARVERLMTEHIKAHPHLKEQVRLLVTIPGVGTLTAAGILAEAGDPTRFACAKQLAAFAGLTPREHTSGTSVRGAHHISKLGSPHLRRLLYMAAVVAKNHNPTVKAFCQRLVDHGKVDKLVVVAAMRKLLHIAFGVLRSGTAFQTTAA